MPAKIHITSGERFGRLIVVSIAPNRGVRTAWLCTCDCGNTCIATTKGLRNNYTRSCGCLKSELTRKHLLGKKTGPSKRRIDLIGKKFGRLTVTSVAHAKHNRVYWNCKCDCGGQSITEGSALRSGMSRSCGCLVAEKIGNLNRSHGMSRRAEYRIWCRMIQRCTNPHVAHYEDYGGRGIKICDRWRHSFEAFFHDIEPRPSPKHSIDRINNDKGYEPGNCRWATQQEQGNNTRTNVKITFNGVTNCRTAWARIIGVKRQRLERYTIDETLALIEDHFKRAL